MSHMGIYGGYITGLDEYFAACRNEIICLTYQGQLVGFRLFVTRPWEGKLRFEFLEFGEEYVTSEEKHKFITKNQALWRTLELKQAEGKLVADDELFEEVQVTELTDEKLVDKYLGYAIIGIQRREMYDSWEFHWFSMSGYPQAVNKNGGFPVGCGFRCLVLNADGDWVREKKDYMVRDFVYNPSKSKAASKNCEFKKFIRNVKCVKEETWDFTDADIETARLIKGGELVCTIDESNLPGKDN